MPMARPMRSAPAAPSWAMRQPPTSKRMAAGFSDNRGSSYMPLIRRTWVRSALDREERKRLDTERRKQQRARESLQRRIAELEGRIAAREAEVKELEGAMAAPGFYENHEASRTVIDRHQALMWEVGDLMSQWESLQEHATEAASES